MSAKLILQEIQDALLAIKDNPQELNRTDPGQDLFALFCKIGCDSNVNAAHSIMNIDDVLVSSIAQLVTDLQDWLLRFLNDYPEEIPIDYDCPMPAWQLITRSGIQFLFDLFKDVQVSIDADPTAAGTTIRLGIIFDELRPYVEDIDERILVSKSVFFVITKDDVPKNMPETHHWWW